MELGQDCVEVPVMILCSKLVTDVDLFLFQMMRNGCLTLCHFKIPEEVVRGETMQLNSTVVRQCVFELTECCQAMCV